MADKKISQLSAATTPLAGTEILPIVQSGTTTEVSVANLTNGRAVNALSIQGGNLKISANQIDNTATDGPLQINLGGLGSLGLNQSPTQWNTFYKAVQIKNASAFWGYDDGGASAVGFGCNYDYGKYSQSRAAMNFGYDTWNQIASLNFYSSGTAGNSVSLSKSWTWDSSGNYTNTNGNYVVGTAAKGINFTANTPAAGMTSQLLNWYEEGAWTPTQGAGLTVVGAFTSSGRYTRIGRVVTVWGKLQGATSVAAAQTSIICGGLPFTPSDEFTGSAQTSNYNSGYFIGCSGTNVYVWSAAIVAVNQIKFTLTYMI